MRWNKQKNRLAVVSPKFDQVMIRSLEPAASCASRADLMRQGRWRRESAQNCAYSQHLLNAFIPRTLEKNAFAVAATGMGGQHTSVSATRIEASRSHRFTRKSKLITVPVAVAADYQPMVF